MPSSASRAPSFADHPRSIAVLIIGFTLLRLVLAAAVPLLPQEAYYWSWSRHLDWSYFDHPPLATYSIALTTAVFGQTVFGIKLAAVLWSLGWNLMWVRLMQDMFGDRRAAFWSLLALNLTGAYEVFALAPTPDAPLVFAWICAIWATWKLSATQDKRWWWAIGFFTGLSWLGKYSGVLLLPIVFLYVLSTPHLRRHLLRPEPYLALVLAALVFSPVIYWNSQNHWVSLAFQSSRRMGEMAGFKPRYFAMLVATQFLLLTPYPFVLAIGGMWRGARAWSARQLDDPGRLLLLSGAVPLLIFTALSFRSIIKINWLAPAYWSLIILGVHQVLRLAVTEKRLSRWLGLSAALLIAGSLVVLVPNVPVSGDMNTWDGWDDAAEHVEKAQKSIEAEGKASFVFSPNYKISSLIRFYMPGNPRTYAQDIYGEKALEFDYFPLPSDMKGATGILVLSNQDQSDLDLKRLEPWFDTVTKVDTIETRAFGKVTRRVDIYRCDNYRGHPKWPRSPGR